MKKSEFLIEKQDKYTHLYHTTMPQFQDVYAEFEVKQGFVAKRTDLWVKYGLTLGSMIHNIAMVGKVRRITLLPYMLKVELVLRAPADKWTQIDSIVRSSFLVIEEEGELGLKDSQVIVDEYEDRLTFRFGSQISKHKHPEILRQNIISSLGEFLEKDDTVLVKSIFEIGGVIAVELNTFRLTVTKARLFEWKHLQPIIIDVIMDVVEKDDMDLAFFYYDEPI